MTKETIMNTYAIEQGYLNYEHLIDRIIDNNSLELARDLILEHQRINSLIGIILKVLLGCTILKLSFNT